MKKLGRVFNFRHGCIQAVHLLSFEVKLSNLKLKNWNKQLLGFLSLGIALHLITSQLRAVSWIGTLPSKNVSFKKKTKAQRQIKMQTLTNEAQWRCILKTKFGQQLKLKKYFTKFLQFKHLLRFWKKWSYFGATTFSIMAVNKEHLRLWHR
jgi:hypothetical protein